MEENGGCVFNLKFGSISLPRRVIKRGVEGDLSIQLSIKSDDLS